MNRYALCVAGGPIASVVFMLLCWLACIQYGSGDREWIGSLFWVSLFTLLLAVIPITAGLNKSDSARLWQLLQHPERARAWIAILMIQTEEVDGLRPRDWSPETFQQMMQADAFGGEFLSCQFLAYYRFLERAPKLGRWIIWKMRSPNRAVLELHCGMRYFWKPRRRARLFENKLPKLVPGASGHVNCGNPSRSMLWMEQSQCARDATRRRPSTGRPRRPTWNAGGSTPV
jgi:hypothetical protein